MSSNNKVITLWKSGGFPLAGIQRLFGKTVEETPRRRQIFFTVFQMNSPSLPPLIEIHVCSAFPSPGAFYGTKTWANGGEGQAFRSLIN